MTAPWGDRIAARPDGIVFDWDGVLLDTETCWTDAKHTIFHRRRRELPDKVLQETFGRQPAASARILAKHLPGATAEGLLDELLESALMNVSQYATMLPGALDVVEVAARLGPVGLASNSPRAVLDAGLQYSGLRDYFTTTVASDEVTAGKPSPDLYLQAVQELGLSPSRSVAFEDSSVGVAAAAGAGLTVIGVSDRRTLPQRGPGTDGVIIQLDTLTDPKFVELLEVWLVQAQADSSS